MLVRSNGTPACARYVKLLPPSWWCPCGHAYLRRTALLVQGMPVFGDTTGKRGALHVRFRVCFPSHLSPQQQQMLRQALAGSDEQPQMQCVPRMVAAAVVQAAGMLPRPGAGVPLLPPSPTAAQQEEMQQQQAQAQRAEKQSQHIHKKQHAKLTWPAAAAGGVGLSSSPGSSGSAWTAAAAGGQGMSAFAQAAAAGTCSVASSSSAAGLACAMQSTGSSREPLVFGRQG